jgi:hypothetical protein
MKKIILFFGLIAITGFVYGQNNQTGKHLLQGRWEAETRNGFTNVFHFFPETNEVIAYIADMNWGNPGATRIPFTYDRENNIITIQITNRIIAPNGDPFISFLFIANFPDGPQMLVYFGDGWMVFKRVGN